MNPLFLALGVLMFAVGIRPGVNTMITRQQVSRSLPTSTGTWFVAGTANRGPLAATLVHSIAEFVTKFGDRQTYSLLYDALDAYFHEGGRTACIGRVVGPNPVLATLSLAAGGDTSLVVTAIGPGSYANAYKVQVAAGAVSGFKLIIKDGSDGDAVLETSPDFADQASAIVWAQNSAYIRLALGDSTSNPDVAAAASLTLGDDDRANAGDAQWAAALASFSGDFGPGQVSMPGRTSTTAHGQLLDHAAAYGRVAMCDAPDTGTVATLVAAAVAARSNGNVGGMWAPWALIPGVVPNTTRAVPWTAILAGIIARNDVQFDANVAAAGDRGRSLYATGLTHNWTDADRESLNDQGVNVAIMSEGAAKNYGYRTLANPLTFPDDLSFGAARMLMQIKARGGAILERHMFDEIDGQGRLFGRVTGELTAMLNEFFTAGSLFGLTPAEAFSVVCDTSNNTSDTIAAKELHATVAVRISEFAEMIEFDIVKVPVNQPIA